MRKELDDLLCQRYPEIFRDRHGDKRETCMCWGFPGDGWFDLINTLCYQIAEAVKAGDMPPVFASQVKEKFGTLRFYYYGGNDETERLTDLAETKSETTCEVCGQPGTLLRDGCWRVRCDSCEAELQRQQEEKARLAAGEYSLDKAPSLLLSGEFLNAIMLVRYNGYEAVKEQWLAIRDTPDAVGVRDAVDVVMRKIGERKK